MSKAKRIRESDGFYKYYLDDEYIFAVGKTSKVNNVQGTAQMSGWVWDWGTGWIGLKASGSLKFAESILLDKLLTDKQWHEYSLIRRSPTGTTVLTQEEADNWYWIRDKAIDLLEDLN